MGFSRQEYCGGLSCPPPGDLPNPVIGPRSPTLQADSLPSEPPGEPIGNIQIVQAPQLEYWAVWMPLKPGQWKARFLYFFIKKKKQKKQKILFLKHLFIWLCQVLVETFGIFRPSLQYVGSLEVACGCGSSSLIRGCFWAPALGAWNL